MAEEEESLEAAADAIASADTILPLIRRVSPGALEKAELREQSGLDVQEIREGLAVLSEQGRITETEDGYAITQAAQSTVKAAAAAAEAGEQQPGEEKRTPGAADAAAPPSVPGQTQSYRVTVEVTITYGGADNDDQAVHLAASMEEDIADLLHKQYPHGVVAADVQKVEAYSPRVIYGDDTD